jgi:hypothetical protein
MAGYLSQIIGLHAHRELRASKRAARIASGAGWPSMGFVATV